MSSIDDLQPLPTPARFTRATSPEYADLSSSFHTVLSKEDDSGSTWAKDDSTWANTCDGMTSDDYSLKLVQEPLPPPSHENDIAELFSCSAGAYHH